MEDLGNNEATFARIRARAEQLIGAWEAQAGWSDLPGEVAELNNMVGLPDEVQWHGHTNAQRARATAYEVVAANYVITSNNDMEREAKVFTRAWSYAMGEDGAELSDRDPRIDHPSTQPSEPEQADPSPHLRLLPQPEPVSRYDGMGLD